MRFDPNAYGRGVADILALDGHGDRLMPLAGAKCSSQAARAALQSASARQLFPGARAPEAAMAGLWLYFSCWDEAHGVAQDVETQEGSYWHAIVHRQEPDDGNATYWFRQVGRHAIFAELAKAAGQADWDPIAFIRLCAEARSSPGSDLEKQALELQRTEWQLLFDYCAAEGRR